MRSFAVSRRPSMRNQALATHTPASVPSTPATCAAALRPAGGVAHHRCRYPSWRRDRGTVVGGPVADPCRHDILLPGCDLTVSLPAASAAGSIGCLTRDRPSQLANDLTFSSHDIYSAAALSPPSRTPRKAEPPDEPGLRRGAGAGCLRQPAGLLGPRRLASSMARTDALAVATSRGQARRPARDSSPAIRSGTRKTRKVYSRPFAFPAWRRRPRPLRRRPSRGRRRRTATPSRTGTLPPTLRWTAARSALPRRGPTASAMMSSRAASSGGFGAPSSKAPPMSSGSATATDVAAMAAPAPGATPAGRPRAPGPGRGRGRGAAAGPRPAPGGHPGQRAAADDQDQRGGHRLAIP